MERLIKDFTTQLKTALDIALQFNLNYDDNTITNVVICGLGGSGIGGTIIKNWAFNQLLIPININKDYSIPKYINKNSLVIIASYSGNTEETIAAFHTAIEQNANIITISSGGKIELIAAELHLPHIKIPANMPPRSCLGYSLVQIFRALEVYKLIDNAYIDDIIKSIELLNINQSAIIEESKLLAENINTNIPIIYSASNIEGIAVRWRQQMNENSKILCWHHVIPEMNHNELVGWNKKETDKFVIFLRNQFEHPRVQTRFEIVKDILQEYCDNIYEIKAKGDSYITEMFYLIHFGDWLSLHLSKLNHVDATEIKVIDYLKSEIEIRSNV